MAYELAPLGAPSVGIGGMGFLAIALHRQNTSFGAMATSTALGDDVRVTGDDVWPTGLEPIKFPVTAEGTQLTFKSVGEGSGKRVTGEMKCMVYGLSAEDVDFLTKASREGIVAYQKTPNCADAAMIRAGGCIPAELEFDFDSKTIKEGVHAYSVTIKFFTAPYFYEGAITYRS